ncbi:bone morphogenetic protein 6 isoform X2 [Photinus pyralis]|nr:bone morphogenetic protein 6 isoform X2 [Photinus pyralis]
MMRTYLHTLRESMDNHSVPELQTFDAETITWHPKKKYVTRLGFSGVSMSSEMEIEQADLRILVSSFVDAPSPTIKIYQILSARRRRLLDEKVVYLSSTASKWCEFDVTSGVDSWLKGNRNLGIELQCAQCNNSVLQPLQATLSILVYTTPKRVRRSSPYNYEEGGRTDCINGEKRQKCCRHTMKVTFKDLKVPQISSIIQPKSYEAGFCKGRCPYNYNHATNHSRIQSLVHKLDRKAVPRVCCAPSKLAPLDVLRVDPYDYTKLNVEKWDNMKVLECACS